MPNYDIYYVQEDLDHYEESISSFPWALDPHGRFIYIIFCCCCCFDGLKLIHGLVWILAGGGLVRSVEAGGNRFQPSAAGRSVSAGLQSSTCHMFRQTAAIFTGYRVRQVKFCVLWGLRITWTFFIIIYCIIKNY